MSAPNEPYDDPKPAARGPDLLGRLASLGPDAQGEIDESLHHDAPTLDSFRNIYLRTRLGQLDCLGEVLGVGEFSAVAAQSVEIDLHGARCRVISLDALIAAKTAMHRDRDRLAIDQLQPIKVLRENPPSG